MTIPSAEGGTKRRRWWDAVIGLVSTIVLIMACELLARGVMWHPRSGLSAGVVDYGYNQGGQGDLVPNQDGIWTTWLHRPHHVQTNSVGLRNTEEPDDGRIRILTVGDSLTFGPFVPNEDTWPAWLESILNAQLYPSQSVQVLNAGVSGYTIEDELAYLREKGLGLQPDLVILAVFPNDISDLMPEQRELLARGVQQQPSGPHRITLSGIRLYLSEHSAAYNVIRNLRDRLVSPGEAPRVAEGAAWLRSGSLAAEAAAADRRRAQYRAIVYLTPEDAENHGYWVRYDGLLRETIDLLRSSGVPLAVVAFPDFIQLPTNGYPDGAQRFFAGIAEGEHTPYLDLLPTLRAAGAPDVISLVTFHPDAALDEGARFFPERTQYVGDGHYSRYGYYVAARAIADWIISLELLPAP
jgi:hypothetical protein